MELKESKQIRQYYLHDRAPGVYSTLTTIPIQIALSGDGSVALTAATPESDGDQEGNAGTLRTRSYQTYNTVAIFQLLKSAYSYSSELARGLIR
jgi:hypothetical protein